MKDFPTPADAAGLSNSVEFMESDKKKKRDPLGVGMLARDKQLIINVKGCIIHFIAQLLQRYCHNQSNPLS